MSEDGVGRRLHAECQSMTTSRSYRLSQNKVGHVMITDDWLLHNQPAT
jgi:hypothetical protein